MRLPRKSTAEETLSPEVERELEAIERALAGREVDPDLAALATLTEDLRDERPEPDEEWRLGMDVRAGSGFGRPPADRLRVLLGGREPRSLLLGAGALATVAVIAAVAISVPSGTEDEGPAAGAGGEGVQDLFSGDGGTNALPVPESAEDGSSSARLRGLQRSARRATDRDAVAQKGFVQGESAPGLDSLAAGSGGSDRQARGEQDRRQDRDASLTLQAGPSEVREVSDQVIQIAESAGGVVASANLSEGERTAVATLDLQIPTRELDATLDRLTDLANVKQLNESAVDITKPFVDARDRLRDARAERRELLRALGNASSETEAESLRRQLQDVRREISRAESRFENIGRRARLSTVFVQIEGRPGLETDDGWSLGDAADDALDALETVAGVMLVAAAILAPIAILIAAIAWAVLAARRRRRESALDE